MLYTVPVVLGHLLMAAMPGGGEDDDDWLEKLPKELLTEQLDYLMGLMVIVAEFRGAAKMALSLSDRPLDYKGPTGIRLVTDTYDLSQQIAQHEFDGVFAKSAINVAGDITGLPSAQLNRSIKGIEALNDGETQNPAAIAFGFRK